MGASGRELGEKKKFRRYLVRPLESGVNRVSQRLRGGVTCSKYEPSGIRGSGLQRGSGVGDGALGNNELFFLLSLGQSRQSQSEERVTARKLGSGTKDNSSPTQSNLGNPQNPCAT